MTSSSAGRVVVAVHWLDPDKSGDLSLPSYETDGASGMDVCAALEGDYLLQPGGRILVPTGLAVAIPQGYEIQVRPRSGLAVRHGVTILNAPGTIDSDYRGEIKIVLVNLGEEPYLIKRGDRIAQLVVAPVVTACLQVRDRLEPTRRGDGGFGHTGVR
jgi:dUTP pyrophosphatase